MRLNTNARAHVIRERRKKKVKNLKSLASIHFCSKKEKKEGIFFFAKTSVLFPLQSFLARIREKEYDDDVCEQCEYHWTWRSSQEHYEY